MISAPRRILGLCRHCGGLTEYLPSSPRCHRVWRMVIEGKRPALCPGKPGPINTVTDEVRGLIDASYTLGGWDAVDALWWALAAEGRV